MTYQTLINFENKLHGFHTRLKELHFDAPTISIHKIIDEFDSSLQEFDDNVMEDAQGILGFIKPGDLSPVLPKSVTIQDILPEIRGVIAEVYENIKDSLTWTGVCNEIEDFWHTINKTIYLIKIATNDNCQE